MDLKEVMARQVFAVAGDTLRPEKYACKIKSGLLERGCRVYGVGAELESLDELPEDVEILDLCIRPERGLTLLQQSARRFSCVVIQPGAESPELFRWLDAHGMDYLQGCLLMGMRLYPKEA